VQSIAFGENLNNFQKMAPYQLAYRAQATRERLATVWALLISGSRSAVSCAATDSVLDDPLHSFTSAATLGVTSTVKSWAAKSPAASLYSSRQWAPVGRGTALLGCTHSAKELFVKSGVRELIKRRSCRVDTFG